MMVIVTARPIQRNRRCVVASAFIQPAFAGAGCDLNVRINNQSPNAIAVYGVSHRLDRQD
jgi:hypothetical protein